ncbi:MAG: diphthamide biosynthesis enzyme Dph2 [Nanoarchaeota archaeon]|nr:diphthamide biosynthesis enzyme Dph2 [Nanoarchaeota archaeon]
MVIDFETHLAPLRSLEAFEGSKPQKEIKLALDAHKPKRVLIQAPEGLKTRMQEIAKAIDARKIETVIWIEPCFGACDIPDYAAKAFGCDLIIHIGHAPMGVKSEVPVAYIEYSMNADFEKILIKNASALSKYKSIGIITTVQYVGDIEKAKEFLEKSGKEVFVGKSKSLKYAGQVLGCDVAAAQSVEKDVNAFVFLGSGRFHALGVLKKTKKPVLIVDVESGAIIDISSERALIEKKRILLNIKFREAKKAGLLLSSKKGQHSGKDIFALKEKIEALGKTVDIIAADYVSPEKILGMKFDILVNCACSRIEDDLVFKEPVINADEIEF